MIRLLKIKHGHFSSNVKQRIMQERLSRLNNSPTSLPLQSSQKLSLYRNIATIAHIDAGKTTLTERMLYMCGAIPWLGEVHHGTALMDFMEEERKRGITINSACITFSWKGTHINLIDTPGHADFNFEVERSLKVLDGALIIIDAVKGVEAQTEIVWKQADYYNLAKLLVINKMDRMGADYTQSIKSVENLIGSKVLPAFYPKLRNDTFQGIVDIFRNKIYYWNSKDENNVTRYIKGSQKDEPASADQQSNKNSATEDVTPFPPATQLESFEFYEEELDLEKLSDEEREFHNKCIERMVEILSEKFESVTEQYINALDSKGSINRDFIKNLQQLCKDAIHDYPKKYCIAIPCSALKNKGVQCVLDSVIEYLPPPTDQFTGWKEPFLFVFKTIVDQAYGILAFTKIMAGKLNRNHSLFNTVATNESKVAKMYRIRANEYAEIESAEAGDIVALFGLNNVKAGDNLVQSGSLPKYQPFLIKGFELKEPLYNASLEFQNDSAKDTFAKIINNYLLEDPSLRYRFDKETGQYVLSGLGELHIETKLARIKNEHNLKVDVGKIHVAFKEAVSGEFQKVTSFVKNIKGSLKFFELELKVEPLILEDEGELQPPVVEVGLFDHNKKAKKAYNEYLEIFKEAGLAKTPKVNATTEEEPKLMSIEKIHPQDKKQQQAQKHILSKIAFIKNPLEHEVSTENFEFDEENVHNLYYIKSLDFEFIHSIQKILEDLAQNGPLTYSPLVNTKISIVGGQYCPSMFDPLTMKMATVKAFEEIMTKENIALLEPMVQVDITCKNIYVNEIINNAVSKRGGRMGVIESVDVKETTFNIIIPLLSSTNYSSYLRSLTSGDAKFTVRNHNYARVHPQRQPFLVNNY